MLVGDDHARRHRPDQGVGLVHGQLAHVGDAHAGFGPAIQQGRRQVPAGVVAAAPAVQFVLGGQLADPMKGAGQFRRGVDRFRDRVGRVGGSQVGAGEAGLFRARERAVQDLDALQRGAAALGGPGTIDAAAFAGQELQEEIAIQGGSLEAIKGFPEHREPGKGQQSGPLAGATSRHASDHASIHRVEAAIARPARAEHILRAAGFQGGIDSALIEPAAEILKRKDGIHQFRVLISLELLGNAGPDEDHPGFSAEVLLQHQRMGLHGGAERCQRRDLFGKVLPDQFHHRGACGGNVELCGTVHDQAGAGFGDGFGPQGGFRHGCESEGPQGPDEGGRSDALEFRGVGRSEAGHHTRAPPKNLLGAGEVIPHLFGARGANVHARAAVDAAVGDHGGRVLDHLDRLDGAMPHAFVAVLAPPLFGVDGLLEVHANRSAPFTNPPP